MNADNRDRVEGFLRTASMQAQHLADELDPDRKRTHRDETTATMISVLDQIAAASSRGLSVLKVTAR